MPVNRARRLRQIGVLVMSCGLAIAVILYWTGRQAAAVEESAAGFTRAQEHQMKMLMGPLAVAMSEWADALTSPAGEAIMVAAFAAFVAYMCFRHAKMEG